MTSGHFENFAEAVARQQTRPAPVTVPAYRRITVLGGGADAQMLAALALAESFEVTLFSAYGAEIDALRAAGVIALRDAGPLGAYQIDRDDAPSIRTTMELDRAVADAEVIFLTGPIHKQRTYAMVLADHVRDGQVLVLAPGRTFGALEVAWLLRVGGAKAAVTIVEAGGLPFWCVAEGARLSLSSAGPVYAASLPSSSSNLLQGLGSILPNLRPAISLLHASFADGSGVVEVPALLLGGPLIGDGRPAVPMGGVPLAENESFRNLIGEKHRAVIENLAAERADVARHFGVRDLPDVEAWLGIHAGTPKGDGSRPIPSRTEAASLLRDAIIGSLVPLSSAAQVTGQPTPVTDAMITLASSVLDADIGSAGRRLDNIGIDAGNIDDARRIMDRMIMAEPARAVR
ncbi:MAG: hypothetical protein ACR2RF_12190 [Geminicoccaceae bacterium]